MTFYGSFQKESFWCGFTCQEVCVREQMLNWHGFLCWWKQSAEVAMSVFPSAPFECSTPRLWSFLGTGHLAWGNVKKLKVWHAKMVSAKKEMVTAMYPSCVSTLLYLLFVTAWWVSGITQKYFRPLVFWDSSLCLKLVRESYTPCPRGDDII